MAGRDVVTVLVLTVGFIRVFSVFSFPDGKFVCMRTRIGAERVCLRCEAQFMYLCWCGGWRPSGLQSQCFIHIQTVYECVFQFLHSSVCVGNRTTRPGESHDCCVFFSLRSVACEATSLECRARDLTLALIHSTTISAPHRNKLSIKLCDGVSAIPIVAFAGVCLRAYICVLTRYQLRLLPCIFDAIYVFAFYS